MSKEHIKSVLREVGRTDVVELQKQGEEITDPVLLNVDGGRYIFSLFKRFKIWSSWKMND